MNTNVGYRSCSNFCRWFRGIGIRIWFCVIFVISWSIFNGLFVEPIRRPLPLSPFPGQLNEEDVSFARHLLDWFGWLFEEVGYQLGLFQLSHETITKYGLSATMWIFLLRAYSASYIDISFTLIWHLLIMKVPAPESRQQQQQRSRKASIGGTGLLGTVSYVPPFKRQPVHCICIRLLTRGDSIAQHLARNAITAALNIFSDQCECEHLKVHIVTQTRFLDEHTKKAWVHLGATEVEERFVPPNYVTTKGTLYKARNICYWQDVGGVGKECDETRSWILSLDEESIITEQLVESFIDEVLNSKDYPRIGYGMGSPIMDPTMYPTSLTAMMLEARTMGYHYTYLMRGKDQLLTGTSLFHGGSYFARANVDRAVDNDVGLMCSVGDDYALGIATKEAQVGFKVLNGWFREGPVPHLRGFIIHRSRVIRGQIYATYFTPMGRMRQLAQWGRLTSWIVYPFAHLCLISCALVIGTPTGPSCTLLDVVMILGITAPMITIAFSVSYMDIPDRQRILLILSGPMAFLFICPICDAMVMIWLIVGMVKDWRNGGVSYEMTSKSKKKQLQLQEDISKANLECKSR